MLNKPLHILALKFYKIGTVQYLARRALGTPSLASMDQIWVDSIKSRPLQCWKYVKLVSVSGRLSPRDTSTKVNKWLLFVYFLIQKSSLLLFSLALNGPNRNQGGQCFIDPLDIILNNGLINLPRVRKFDTGVVFPSLHSKEAYFWGWAYIQSNQVLPERKMFN